MPLMLIPSSLQRKVGTGSELFGDGCLWFSRALFITPEKNHGRLRPVAALRGAATISVTSLAPTPLALDARVGPQGQGPAAGSDDEGESVRRSSDSDADQSGAESEIGSITGAPRGDFQGSGSKEDNADYSGIASDDEEGREAALASAYDVSSMDLDDQQKIFDGPDSDDD
ncbi:hypothetical protein DFH09DRAFT_1379695 [Mycena vulgaris]|nr:hypothetical protein DFH09DRAFT_1379695 [Mycena vulgaris]